LSEEFGGALPSAIIAEQRRLPAGFLEQVLEYRQLARAIAIYEQNPKAEGALVQFVRMLDFEMTAEELAGRHAE
jgi:hypothetical protein